MGASRCANAWLAPAVLLGLAIGSAFTMADAQTPPRPPRPRLPLELLSDTLAICRLDAKAPVPEWTRDSRTFLTLSRTPDELSITAAESSVPEGVRCERPYRALRVRGPLPLDLVGILAAIADPLASAGLSIFAISTFETDYVLVRAADLEPAIRVLERAGHQVRR